MNANPHSLIQAMSDDPAVIVMGVNRWGNHQDCDRIVTRPRKSIKAPGGGIAYLTMEEQWESLNVSLLNL